MKYRADIPPVPDRLKHLPVQGGYPVPWFVPEINGAYDFRGIDGAKFSKALRHRRCFICGDRLGKNLAFPIGPMCAINRTISEPPSHRECAEWSARACPFLAQRQDERRLEGLPKNPIKPAGHSIDRQPGAVCIWVCHDFTMFRASGGMGVLFKIGNPKEVIWYCQGKTATRAEVMASIDSGLPLLLELAAQDGEKAIAEVNRRRIEVELYLPHA
jgi:hypothetical protein